METFKEMSAIMAFVQVGKTRSFTLAAQQMQVSKSHLSKSVRELEEKFGQDLFRRSTRYVDFTEFGRRYFEMCREHMDEIFQITKQSKEMSESVVLETGVRVDIKVCTIVGQESLKLVVRTIN